MDAFYAAVEARDDPALQGIPMAVAASARHGVVMTASYPARAYGVRSAMPTARALQLCPGLVLVPPRHEAYRIASLAIRGVMRRLTPLVEPLSLDEAYLDVTGLGLSATDQARHLKAEILAETGLTASAGVSFNKFLAKQASDLDKPDGLAVIRPKDALTFLASLPVERFHGVGPASARRLHAAGIATGADIQSRPEHVLHALLGATGRHLWRMAKAEDDRPVVPDRPRKSLSVETTFTDDLRGFEAVAAALPPLAADLAARIARAGFSGNVLTLKLRYAPYRLRTRQSPQSRPLDAPAPLLEAARRLLARDPLEGPVRLLGLGVSKAETVAAEEQLPLPLG